jgi:hypothetical protein
MSNLTHLYKQHKNDGKNSYCKGKRRRKGPEKKPLFKMEIN